MPTNAEESKAYLKKIFALNFTKKTMAKKMEDSLAELKNTTVLQLLQSLRFAVYPKLQEFIRKMKQTGPVKQMLSSSIGRMYTDTYQNVLNEAKAGFKKKMDAVVALGYEID